MMPSDTQHAQNRFALTHRRWWMLLLALVLTVAVYAPGLSGGFLFDDYPNIVDNVGVQPHDASVSSLVRAALSSPSSEFKRPLASLTFAVNYLLTGLDPFWMKLTNVVIHLLNGCVLFVLTRLLLLAVWRDERRSANLLAPLHRADADDAIRRHAGLVAALIAGGWMLLPINLTAVLYVVQRMESLANLFVLLGLLGYVLARRRMLDPASRKGGLGWCVFSIIVPMLLGVTAKETAVMLPLYALLIEWLVFRFRRRPAADALAQTTDTPRNDPPRRDWRLFALYVIVLVMPIIIGLAWLLPGLLHPGRWATRDFTLGTRLLSEARIVVDYVVWTILPTPHALSFYHDYFHISTGLLSPWTTLACIVVLMIMVAGVWVLRRRAPLVSLGIALFLGCHLLTGTILPLELIYEHRNYFASFGLLLALVPLLAAPPSETTAPATRPLALPMALPRYVMLGGLLVLWSGLTALTAHAWGNPLSMAQDLADRAPQSPRAQYELGRTYIIYSHYKPDSMFTKLAYAPLERSAALPDSSILAEQALIFMNAHMHLPIKDAWWDSMVRKLKAKKPGVQDESSLGALTQCVRDNRCDLPANRMVQAFTAALQHPHPRPRLLAIYADYAWNVLDDRELGERMNAQASRAAPDEPAYHITEANMLIAMGRYAEAREQIKALQSLNIGGRFDGTIAGIKANLPSTAAPATSRIQAANPALPTSTAR